MEWPNVKKVVKIKSRKKYPIILACMQKKHALKILLSFKSLRCTFVLRNSCCMVGELIKTVLVIHAYSLQTIIPVISFLLIKTQQFGACRHTLLC